MSVNALNQLFESFSISAVVDVLERSINNVSAEDCMRSLVGLLDESIGVAIVKSCLSERVTSGELQNGI